VRSVDSNRESRYCSLKGHILLYKVIIMMWQSRIRWSTIVCNTAILLLFFSVERAAVANQLTAPLASSGSNYRSMDNSYGSISALRMGQDDVPGGSNRFERGYAVFDLRTLPATAEISQVRLRYDCTWVDTTDPDGVMFTAEIGPLTINKATWDSATSQERWRTGYSNYSGFYQKSLFSTDTYNDYYISLDSTARSRIESRAGDYVVFHFRLATQNDVWNKDPSWSGDTYHSDSVVPDWARIDYGWDIFNVTGTTDDDWLAVFSDLRLIIDYTVPILPELSNPTMNTFSGNPETDFYYYVDYYHAGGEAPKSKYVYIDGGSANTMTLVSGDAWDGTYRYGPKRLAPGDHSCEFGFEDQSGHTARSPGDHGVWTMPFVGAYKAINPSPSNGATGQSINVDLSWSDGGGATSYDVFFQPEGGSGTTWLDWASTSKSLPTLDYERKYYWRIDSKKAGYDTTTGDTWEFTTEAAPTYTLSTGVSPSGGGSVTKSPSKSGYNYNESVQLAANANPGYTFSHWSGDASGSSNPTAITMSSNKSVTANFTASNYTLNTAASPSAGGSVTKNPSKSNYTYNESVQLTATANSGYAFSHWSGDASGSSNPTTITMNSNKSVTANFTASGYTLEVGVSPSGGGSVVRNPDKSSYNPDESVQLTAIANSGYAFGYWSGDASGPSNPITITMNANKSVTARFEEVAAPVIHGITPGSGLPGSAVLIEGSNFGAAAGSVRFGGVSSSGIVSWSDTAIQCLVPEVNVPGPLMTDDFEDGAINGSLWVTGGGGRGWQQSDPLGAGSWQYSHTETGSPDGYLEALV
jgi:uncharacterized repeat protein (TIGR02543 family)